MAIYGIYFLAFYSEILLWHAIGHLTPYLASFLASMLTFSLTWALSSGAGG